ncbi:AraC family transcriptional regulator [Chryseolinea sp. H1M3-3]|uniref:helix-turn-helix domain-containing protein n=1 Tax=Chryseolinea sp. H1M3-3 TaxID=3034144 RepID=UPI0023EC4E5D|nr:AraC family transcriptional regulator [Chryseolinea sp. H1M3-3]
MTTEILIKGMVCERCVSVIKDGLTALGYKINKISLGKLFIETELNKNDQSRVEYFLAENGFTLISNRQLRIVTQAKELIADVFNKNTKYDSNLKFSSLLSENLHMNYDSISALFTELEGITLEKYIIAKRLEKVKELLVYTEFTLTEIAYITGFSSINHLSRQFKELTGFPPSHFKSVRQSKQTLSGKTTEGNL